MTRQQDSGSPRALFVTRNLPPLVGGMERLNLQMVRALAQTHTVTVIGPAGCTGHLPAGVQVVEVSTRPLSLFLWRSLVAAWRASSSRYDITIAGSGLTAPMAKLAAWRNGGKALAYVHGLDLVARHPVYRMVWVPFLRALDHAWANSRSTADIAARIGVAKRAITVLHPGVALPADGGSASSSFRDAHALHDAKILLSVGRLTARKGLASFIRLALPAIRARHPDAILLIIGQEAVNAVDARGQGIEAEILQAASDAGVSDAVRILPHCSDEELSTAYQAADVHVFPVVAVKGDIEGFGMVALEAAAHGVPTVAFAIGGIPDAVAHGVSGRLVTPDDYSAFAAQVTYLLGGAGDGLRACAKSFAEGFEWSRFGEKLGREIDKIQSGEDRSSDAPEGHALLDLQSRRLKAMKIEAILGLTARQGRLRILEIGTGSGGIAHYFGTHRSLRCEVVAVDVQDARQVFEGYRFQVVDGVQLPFENSSFDVVISNHVIEHVGSPVAQAAHLAEIGRVLAPAGRGYLAVPNRWMVMEPHYRLAFLSWLPRRLRSHYLRWRRGVPVYDCEPLEAGTLERLFSEANLQCTRAVGRALKLTIELEVVDPKPLSYKMLMKIPDEAIDAIAAIIPTLVYRFGHGGRTGEGVTQ